MLYCAFRIMHGRLWKLDRVYIYVTDHALESMLWKREYIKKF